MRHKLSVLLTGLCFAACTPSGDHRAITVPSAEPVDAPKSAELETIATGANIAGANGIHFGPDGMLYITSVIGSDLTVIDPLSG